MGLLRDTARAIEEEMRRLGLEGPEGSVEHWLEHDVLQALRHEEAPPRGAYDRAHREWVKWGPEEDGPAELLGLLRRLDRLLDFHPTVTRFGVYETVESAETPGGFRCVFGRALRTRFRRLEVRRIAWHVEMTHPVRERILEMVLGWRILQGGTLFQAGTHRSMLPADWTSMAFAQSWGWSEPGRWPAGGYSVEIDYWGAPLARTDFEIE